MRSNKGQGQSFARRNSKDSEEEEETLPPKPSPRALARQRRDSKIAENGSWNDRRGNTVVFTRDVSFLNQEARLVSIGVKRNSINKSKRRVANLIAAGHETSRGVKSRSLKRAERRLEFRISTNQARIEREENTLNG